MANITEDLIVHVLSRLPVETLLRFRCVSKRWCALIDSPNFLSLQLNESLATNNNLTLIFEKLKVDGLYSLGFDSLDDILNHDDHNIVKFDDPFLKADKFDIVGSCNGLICLISLGVNEVLMLLNPSTKKHQILPPMPPPSSEICDTVHGFGYDPVNDDYKIVNVATLFDDEVNPLGSEITVFSLKSNVWRRINHRFSNLLRPGQHGVFFNGALHWVATRQPELHEDNYIAAFDLRVENFREVQLPKDFWSVTLGVSGGCLWLFGINVNDDDHLELWVMNNYVMREMSWTKHSLSFFSHVCWK
ncbi:F-box protein CPR1-like [Cornus florida]|uniref:F-box protein CPR1-like n=1 Tax=Cornus florida TaxID=4283 RepID=UPI002898B8BC|nr:F-box protein CPR1-like [Cornus florida]